MVKTSPSSVGVVGSIPGKEAKIPHALGPKHQNIKQKKYCNKFNKDLNILKKETIHRGLAKCPAQLGLPRYGSLHAYHKPI